MEMEGGGKVGISNHQPGFLVWPKAGGTISPVTSNEMYPRVFLVCVQQIFIRSIQYYLRFISNDN